MAEAVKVSTPIRIGGTIGAAVLGFFAAWLALDASQTSGRYWPIHVVSGPIFTLANYGHETHYAWLTFIGTGLLFGFYAWCATKFRSLAVLLVIAVAHAGLAAWGVAGAAQQT
jgi:hypothetical protein